MKMYLYAAQAEEMARSECFYAEIGIDSNNTEVTRLAEKK
jgi:hypothetical protein